MFCTIDKFLFSMVFCTKTCSDIQTLPVETNLYYVFDWEEKVGRCPTLNFMIRNNWTVTFSTHRSVYLEFFRAITSETILKKKVTVQFL